MAEGKFVSYIRVSTKRQGKSGLGLEAQRKAVDDFLNGGNWSVISEHVEVESGKKGDQHRPELAKALQACRLYGAKTLGVPFFARRTCRRPVASSTCNALMDAAYDDQVYVDDRTIDSHIKRLRKKLTGPQH